MAKYNYNINKPCCSIESEADRKNLARQLKIAIDHMLETEVEGTYYWYLDTTDEQNNWAIVLGWMTYDGAEELCVKLAYQPNNSLMQCDYDIDWLMPYDEETGEVDDNELTVGKDEDTVEIINWFLDSYRLHFAD